MMMAQQYPEHLACCSCQCLEHPCAGVGLSELECCCSNLRLVGFLFALVQSYEFDESLGLVGACVFQGDGLEVSAKEDHCRQDREVPLHQLVHERCERA